MDFLARIQRIINFNNVLFNVAMDTLTNLKQGPMNFVIMNNRNASNLSCQLNDNLETNDKNTRGYILLSQSDNLHENIVSYCILHALPN